MSALLRILALAVALVVCAAHVGAPDAWYRGNAGPYPVLIHIQTPGVIPGIAVVNVYVDSTGRATGDTLRVTATANHVAATGGAPPPEIADGVDAQYGLWRARLWIMTSGSYSITVSLSGLRGTGSAVVPLSAVPIRRLPFSRELGLVLGAAGIVLFAGLVMIIGTGVREGVLAPGVAPDTRQKRRGRRAMLKATLLVSVVLLGGWQWWRLEDAAFVRSIFRPYSSEATVRGDSLILSITDTNFVRRMRDTSAPTQIGPRGNPGRPGLLGDHGKIMHLFMIAESNGAAFAHLHPQTSDSISFAVRMPRLPAGQYRVFADIVSRAGFTQTLVTKVEVAASAGSAEFSEGDDSFLVADPSDSNVFVLRDGSVMRWLRDGASQPRAGEEAGLRFSITRPNGAAPLEDYMGMRAHAALARDDGSVFVHLHPMGTISMAAQQRFTGDSSALRTGTKGQNAPLHALHPDNIAEGIRADTLSFPFAFPQPGRYFIWVQAKRGGRVLTAVFSAAVLPAPG